MIEKPLINKNISGQAMVEYILLLVVLVAIITSVMQTVKDRLFAQEGNCTKESQSFICKLDKVVNFGKDSDYKYFTLKR